MTVATAPIPKIVHIIWIGDQSLRPVRFIDSWREKHTPEMGWEVIVWTEEELNRRGVNLQPYMRQIDEIQQMCGKADIIRWHVLYEFGGVAVDADSYCLHTLNEYTFLEKPAKCGWTCFENETVRNGLLAIGSMGFPKRSPMLRRMLDHITTLNLHPAFCSEPAWKTVGNTLLTRTAESGDFPEFTVFPSYMFIPYHFTGMMYHGHRKVYAFQAWGSTLKSYNVMNEASIVPEGIREPPQNQWVSILIPSYNRERRFIRDCLASIKAQEGHFGMEIVWIDDGSDNETSAMVRKELAQFEATTRWTRVVYHKLPTNQGIAHALNVGTNLCNYELVFRMDDDDIMHADRIAKQIEFMQLHPDCPVCGGQIQAFADGAEAAGAPAAYIDITNHNYMVTWENWLQMRSRWIMNHPTLCWRKSVLREIGGYNPEMTCMEDIDIQVRVLKRYGRVYNMPDILVDYRLHSEQLTHKSRGKPENETTFARIVQNALLA